jgi:hypothetical protein
MGLINTGNDLFDPILSFFSFIILASIPRQLQLTVELPPIPQSFAISGNVRSQPLHQILDHLARLVLLPPLFTQDRFPRHSVLPHVSREC